MNRPESEMAYWRRQYEENYESAYCANGNAFAITAPHKFITRRMEKMADALQHIERLGGEQAVRLLLIGNEEEDMTDDGREKERDRTENTGEARKAEAKRKSSVAKPTLHDLWHRHKELQTEALFEVAEVAGIESILVLELFAWSKGTQETIEEVLRVISQLAETNYTQDDIAGLIVCPDS